MPPFPQDTFRGLNKFIYLVTTAQSAVLSPVDLIQAGARGQLLFWPRASSSAEVIVFILYMVVGVRVERALEESVALKGAIKQVPARNNGLYWL
jgi:hypothetical protein